MQILRLFKHSSLFILPSLLSTTCIAGFAQADIIVNGDVAPNDPSSWTDTTVAYIGESSTGSLSITNGDSVSGFLAYVGYGAASNGAVTVDGVGSTWENTYVLDGRTITGSELYLGYLGTGSLTITNGGTVPYLSAYIGYGAGSTGTVRVSGSDFTTLPATVVRSASSLLHVGYAGKGILTITDGGTVSSTFAHVGYETEAEGNVTVDGEETTWSTRTIYIGENGTGVLDVLNGGTVTGTVSYIGANADSTGTVRIQGTDSTWTNSSNVYIGDNGTGTVRISSGAAVSAGNTSLGTASDASGTLTVDGEESILNLQRCTIGEYGNGTFNITGGASSSASTASLGQETDANGTVNVDGQDTTWDISSELFVGEYGNGTLHVSDGAAVTDDSAYIAHSSGSTGTLTLSDGATMTHGKTYVGYAADAEGIITITNNSAMISSYGYLGYNADASGTVTTNGKNGASGWVISNDLYIGYEGQGTLIITDQGGVISKNAYIGKASGSVGTVKISGEDAGLATYLSLSVGYNGTGTLTVADGGVVESTSMVIGSGGSGTVTMNGTGSTLTSNRLDLGTNTSGTATLFVTDGAEVAIGGASYVTGKASVSGEGSQWSNSTFFLGTYGTGTTSISDGGLVRAITGANIYSGSMVSIDVDSNLKIGTSENNWSANINNYGTIRLVAGSGAAAGTYTPLSCGAIYRDGTIQALGGVWDDDARTVTIAGSVTAQGNGGASATLDLSAKQRIVITDTSSGMSAGIGFPATETSTSLTPTIAAIDNDTLTALKSLLTDDEETIVSAWNFSIPTESYTVSETSPVYLSLYANSPTDLASLSIWQLSDGQWSKYSAADLTPDGAFASFTATAAGSYAVTTTNPTSSSSTGSSSKAMPWIPLLLLDD